MAEGQRYKYMRYPCFSVPIGQSLKNHGSLVMKGMINTSRIRVIYVPDIERKGYSV